MLNEERLKPSDKHKTAPTPAEVSHLFETHLPLLERVVSQLLVTGGPSARDLTYLGALVLSRCATDYDAACGLSFKDYAEITLSSELLHHVHYPVPVMKLQAPLAPYKARLDAIAQALGDKQPSAIVPPTYMRPQSMMQAYGGFPLDAYTTSRPEAKAAPAVGSLFWALFKKRLPLILGLIVLSELGVVAYTMKAPKVFVATTTLNSGIGDKGLINGGGDWFTQGTVVANITEELKSRTVLENTIAALGLSTTVTSLGKRITVSRIGATGLLRIDAQAETAERASDLGNALVREFLKFYMAGQSHAARSDKAFFASQVMSAKEQLVRTENRLKRFKGANIPEEQVAIPVRVSDLLTQRDDTSRTLAASRAGLRVASQELHAIKTDPMLTQRIINSGAVLTSSERVRALQLNLQDARAIYGAGSKVVSQLKNKIAQAKSQVQTSAIDATEQNPALAQAMARVIQLRTDVAMNDARLASLNRAIAVMQPKAQHASTSQITYESLQRDVKVAETQYLDLQGKYSASNLQAQGASYLNISIVDPAIPPLKPEDAKLGLKLVLGFVFSLGLGMFLSYLMSLGERAKKTADSASSKPVPGLLNPGLST